MAVVAFSLLINRQFDPRSQILLSTATRTLPVPTPFDQEPIYQIAIEFVAENPHPSYDGDDYSDRIVLLATPLAFLDSLYTLSDAVAEAIRQQVLAILAQLEGAGWSTKYEQRYFQHLSAATDQRWHFQTLPSSHTFFQTALFHAHKPAYSYDTGVQLFEWMRQAPVAS
jgi:hypothetical protein